VGLEGCIKMWMFAGRCESEGLTGASLAGGDLFYDLQHVLALPLWALTWMWIHAPTCFSAVCCDPSPSFNSELNRSPSRCGAFHPMSDRRSAEGSPTSSR